MGWDYKTIGLASRQFLLGTKQDVLVAKCRILIRPVPWVKQARVNFC